MRARLLAWFGALGLAAKVLAVAVLLYGTGYLFGVLGSDSGARELGGAGLFVGAVLVTGLVIRYIYRTYGGRQ